jgi:hypothetical protein
MQTSGAAAHRANDHRRELPPPHIALMDLSAKDKGAQRVGISPHLELHHLSALPKASWCPSQANPWLHTNG